MPKILAAYHKFENIVSIGSKESTILGLLEVQLRTSKENHPRSGWTAGPKSFVWRQRKLDVGAACMQRVLGWTLKSDRVNMG